MEGEKKFRKYVDNSVFGVLGGSENGLISLEMGYGIGGEIKFWCGKRKLDGVRMTIRRC